jgi:hypothetical protein
MRKKLRIHINLLNLLLLLLISGTSLTVSGQEKLSSDGKKPLPPVEEIFEKTDGLALPWRDSGCTGINPVLDKPNCQHISGAEWNASDALTLYNEDGSVWYHFGIEQTNSNYFGKTKKEGFLPFAFRAGRMAGSVFLRMVSESPSWYEVEVNEDTQTTKYILKSDPMWAKRDWDHLFILMKFFKTKENAPELLDKPEGKVTEESAGWTWSHLQFIKTEGDWAYVRGVRNSQHYYGWIRWRQNREILARYDEAIIINQKSK